MPTTDLERSIAEHPSGARVAAATEPLDQVVDVPEYASGEWFERPTWVASWRAEHGLGSDRDPATGLRRLTVTDEGRVGGWFYDRGSCIFGTNPPACPKPSATRYAAFHQQDQVLADGSMIVVGAVGNSAGHVDPDLPLAQALSTYNNPRIQLMRVRAGDDEDGGWLAGTLIPAGARVAAGVDPLTWGHISFLRSCALSGSWYPTAPGGFDPSWWERNGVDQATVQACEGYDCIGPQLVTRPALALRRLRVASVGEPIITTVQPEAPEPCQDCADAAPKEETVAETASLEASLELSTEATEKVVRPLAERIEALEAERDEARQATLRAQVADLEPAELPPPLGFDERTIHLTDADRAELVRQSAMPANLKPSPKSAPDRPQAQRRQDAKSGMAMSDGSYRIATCGDAVNARRAIGRAPAEKRQAVLAHIAKREKALNCDNGGPPGK